MLSSVDIKLGAGGITGEVKVDGHRLNIAGADVRMRLGDTHEVTLQVQPAVVGLELDAANVRYADAAGEPLFRAVGVAEAIAEAVVYAAKYERQNPGYLNESLAKPFAELFMRDYLKRLQARDQQEASKKATGDGR